VTTTAESAGPSIPSPAPTSPLSPTILSITSATPSITSVAPSPPPARHHRDPWFDNTRAVAAVLVALGHVLERVSMDPTTFDALWTGTWPFRIPAYVFLAGWFTSTRPMDVRRFGVLVRDVLLVYVAFVAIDGVQVGREPGDWLTSLTLPPMGTWFLLSLFTWRLLLSLLDRVPGLLLWSLAAAVVVGWFPDVGPQYSASHTIAMFPVFVLGSRLRRTDLRDLLTSRRSRWFAMLFVAAALCGGVLASGLSNIPFAMNDPYVVDPHLSAATAGLVRAALLVVGALGAIALLTLVPRRRIRYLTYLGTGSMYVYLLHLIVIVELQRHGILAQADTVGEVLFVVAATVLVCAALASPPVRAVFRPIVQPRQVWPFAARRTPSRASTSATSP
jgi:fucose 4-O-acetylase-like acetyltransferase